MAVFQLVWSGCYLCEVGLSNLCTSSSSFMQGSCSLSCVVGSSSCKSSGFVIIVEN